MSIISSMHIRPFHKFMCKLKIIYSYPWFILNGGNIIPWQFIKVLPANPLY